MDQRSDSDPELTKTFEGAASLRIAPVEVTGDEVLEHVLLGNGRPERFEDRYEVSGTIGVGGMGEVYLAQDQVLRRDVALKVLRGGSAPNPQVLRRFLREAQLTAQLSHPNVVPFYALEATAVGAPAFVMKWIDGVSLKQWIRDWKSRWSTTEWDHERDGLKARVEFFLKACDAISFAHDRGVIHRDLKPGNLMLGAFNVLYVMDWGIAKVIDEPESEPAFEFVDDPDERPVELPESRTMTGDLVGTPLYMAPEQANPQQSGEVGPASDQYALGLLLFQLLTGEAPRTGDNVVAVIRSASLGQREAWPVVGPAIEVPRELRAIVDRATAPLTGDRYASVVELASDLRRWTRGEEVHASPDRPWRAVWRRVERHPVTVLSAVLALVIALGSASLWALSGKLEAERMVALQGVRIGLVAEHAHQMDRGLADAEQWLSTFGARVEEWLSHAEPTEPDWFAPARLEDEDAPLDTGPHASYAGLVSFDRAVTILAPDADREAAAATLARLSEAPEHFEALFLPQGARRGDPASQQASRAEALARMREGGFLKYAYCGFESGLYYAYPATSSASEGYDPRERTWYVWGRENDRPRWGMPYMGAGGTECLLPCLVALRDKAGVVVGVAGLDLSVQQAIASLEIRGLADLEAVLLVESSTGGVLLDTRESGGVHGHGLQRFVDDTNDLKPVESDELLAELSRGAPSGAVNDGDHAWIYTRLRSIEWVLVARVEL
jgi:eukaryotic-like serine/threonine-protein kinase